ncbi:MAG: aldehyde dehydrogenase family protein [Methanobacteriota archaeon]|nr:MAG: aldehyde dehydrogenase family protein [Euryarchaeota archaeon]
MQELERFGDIVENTIQHQEEFFQTGRTFDVNFRREVLKKLRKTIVKRKEEILDALYEDMGNDRLTGFVKDIGVTIHEIDYILKNLKKWSKSKTKFAGLLAFPALRAKKVPMPRGRVVLITPWNYPILLTLVPLAYAVAAGNTVIVKPSEISKKTSQVVMEIIEETFDPSHVTCFLGGKEVATELIVRKHGLIYFIGGEKVGRIIAEAAAKTLTPTVLELGGKSPAIVDDDKSIKVTAKRIILGKWVNAGQTCVAPDYILVRKEIKEKLVQALINALKEMKLDNAEPTTSSKIINEHHFERLIRLKKGLEDKILFGGVTDRHARFIQITLIDNPPLDHPIMQEEIFGPLLPILEYENENELLSIIGRNPTPLALYIFGSDKKFTRDIHSKVQFGNGCINDTLFQFGVQGLPIGGVGTSGYGYNKGKESFDEFSRMVAILKKPRKIDNPFFYPPHGKLSKWLTELIYRTKL